MMKEILKNCDKNVDDFNHWSQVAYFFPNNSVTLRSELLRANVNDRQLKILEQCVAFELNDKQISLIDKQQQENDSDDNDNSDNSDNNDDEDDDENSNQSIDNSDEEYEEEFQSHGGVYEIRSFRKDVVHIDKSLALILYLLTNNNNRIDIPRNLLPHSLVSNESDEDDDDHYVQARFVL